MSNRYWHSDPRAKGGGFWVTSSDLTPRQQRQVARRRKAFAIVPLQLSGEMVKAIGIPGAMVLILLFYLSWQYQGAPFPFQNTLLARYGVSREAKRRVLKALEKAGLIRVEWRCNQAPIVTLMRDIRSVR
jgi:hypothetical protein